MRTELGKIHEVKFGFGGYQGAQFGIWVWLKSGCAHVSDGRGVWCGKPSSSAKWTMADKQKSMGEIMLYIEDLLDQAKVSDVNKLKDIPVEMTFEGECLKEWRILTEVI